ncbi:hypothetical protein RN001_004275 [Aquatica leii]|uniref:Uncharacterized protein n=1 Tax=Aquatica leii TaxID=1421715 RepID=A0AAN7PI50_9COLE|nr:hypothetical protein RN001_004275 [Aquatica leii]
MVISAVDVKKTKELTQRKERQNMEATRISNYRKYPALSSSACRNVERQPQMRIQLTTFAKIYDRHGISDSRSCISLGEILSTALSTLSNTATHNMQNESLNSDKPNISTSSLSTASQNTQTDCPLKNFFRSKSTQWYPSTSDFSTDQNYLFEICQVITSGHCNTSLSNRKPGKLAHSRWVTTANRILRLYISSENPSSSLMKLTEFIMNVYAPMWFSIKSQPTCNYGAKHLLKSIRLSRYLEKDLRDIVDPVIQRNGFFGHNENIILSMISDERKHIRELGLRRILKARSVLPQKTKNVRVFKLSALCFEANE